MDFGLTTEQQARRDRTLAFARSTLTPGAREREARRFFDRSLFEAAGREGLAGLVIPREHGGQGLGALDTIVTLEALGEGCEDGGLVFSLAAHGLAGALPLARNGSGAQKDRWLAALASGRAIAANAASEADAGSDIFAMSTTARKVDAGYELQGTKRYVTNAPVADVFLVYARTDPARSWFGVSCFLVDAEAAGVRVAGASPKMGLMTAPSGEVCLDGVVVPDEARIGPEGAGAAIFQESMTWERCCLFAAYVGGMQRTLDRCVERAKERRQFGRPIGHNQSISNKLVDMKLRLETSRMLLYRAGWMLDRDGRADEAVALSKLWIAEQAVQSGLDAVQIFGASGTGLDTGVDALLRDSLPARIFSGTSEMQREIVAQHLGLR